MPFEVDVVRCTVVLDDPYAIAVLVAFFQQEMRVVRVKNRFEHDVIEEVAPACLHL